MRKNSGGAAEEAAVLFLEEKAFAYWRETFEVTTEKLILLH